MDFIPSSGSPSIIQSGEQLLKSRSDGLALATWLLIHLNGQHVIQNFPCSGRCTENVWQNTTSCGNLS